MDKPIDLITVEDIQAEVIRLMNNNKSAKTIQNNIFFIGAVLNNNDIKIDMSKIAKPKKQKTIYTTPNLEQARQIINAVRDTDVEIPVLLAMWLGLRASEICGLKWEKVTETAIVIDNAKIFTNGRIYNKKPKTDSGIRQIPTPKPIFELLSRQERKSEYIVDINPNALAKRFSKVLKRAGLPHTRFHDLRHYNASIMKMLNVPDINAMQRGGWSNNSVYTNIYSQVFDEQQIIVAQKIDKYMEKLYNQ